MQRVFVGQINLKRYVKEFIMFFLNLHIVLTKWKVCFSQLFGVHIYYRLNICFIIVLYVAYINPIRVVFFVQG